LRPCIAARTGRRKFGADPSPALAGEGGAKRRMRGVEIPTPVTPTSSPARAGEEAPCTRTLPASPALPYTFLVGI
jgi:hypothetical protein